MGTSIYANTSGIFEEKPTKVKSKYKGRNRRKRKRKSAPRFH